MRKVLLLGVVLSMACVDRYSLRPDRPTRLLPGDRIELQMKDGTVETHEVTSAEVEVREGKLTGFTRSTHFEVPMREVSQVTLLRPAPGKTAATVIGAVLGGIGATALVGGFVTMLVIAWLWGSTR